jgi:hypoxanthine phosphoribosyltransferase
MSKRHITPQELLELSYALGKKVYDDDFKPNWLVALWRGGTPIGIAVQEFLAYKDIQTNHVAIRTSSYEHGVQGRVVKVHNLHYIIENANKDDRLLIVDDIFDSGNTVAEVINQLKTKMRANFPEVRVATIFWRGSEKVTEKPDYYCEISKEWIVFPHELEDLTLEEIRQHKGDKIADLLQ